MSTYSFTKVINNIYLLTPSPQGVTYILFLYTASLLHQTLPYEKRGNDYHFKKLWIDKQILLINIVGNL